MTGGRAAHWWGLLTERRRVRIVVSTGTCLDPEQARLLGITLVPLYVIVDREARRDLFDISPNDVYRLLRRGALLSTSAPSPGDYLAAFQSQPGPVLCLTEASSLSAINGSAKLAAQLWSAP